MSVGAPVYCNKRLGSPCRNEVQKGKYCDKLIGKKDCERECVSREGLGVSERQSRWDFRSTSGSQIGNKKKTVKEWGRKRKDIPLPLYCVLVECGECQS